MSNGDREKTVRSDIYHGGYVTTYGKVALPNYMMRLPSQNDFIMDINGEEELNKRGNGGDSDDDGEDARDFGDTMREVELERSRVMLGD